MFHKYLFRWLVALASMSVVLLGIISCSAAPKPLQGTFNISASQFGTQAVTLQADGRYFLSGQDVKGTYQVSTNQITFVEDNGSCKGMPGIWKWSFDGKILTLTPIEDKCAFRVSDFGKPMTLQE